MSVQSESAWAVVLFDGACPGNPGPMFTMVLINGVETFDAHNIGTGNLAEFMAARIALTESLKLGLKRIVVIGDSKLIIDFMRNRRPPDEPLLREEYDRCVPLVSKFAEVAWCHVDRESSPAGLAIADRLKRLKREAKAAGRDN